MANISIPDDVKDRLERLAASKAQPAAALAARAVTEFLDRETAIDGPALQALRQEGGESWAEFQLNGEHLTGEEVRLWLSSWGTSQETPPPTCHD